MLSLCPTTGLPETTGSPTLTGAAPISSVGFDAAVAESPPIVAVTRTRIRDPTSPLETMYAEVVAPLMVAQSEPSSAPPDDEQRTHWYVIVWGLGLQVPAVAVSVEPTLGLPEIVGSDVLSGASALAATPSPEVNPTERPTTAAAKPINRSALPRRCLRLSSLVIVTPLSSVWTRMGLRPTSIPSTGESRRGPCQGNVSLV